jgi:hypothetical protein
LNTSDNTIANSTNCNIRFENASGSVVKLNNHVNTGSTGYDPITATWDSTTAKLWTFWCSDFNSSKSAEELAIINCPQDTTICGSSN